MTNFEYYKEQIQGLVNDGLDFSVSKYDGQMRPCSEVCGKFTHSCIFSHCNSDDGSGCCVTRKIKWLYEEHVEKPTITKQEKAFLEICKPECYIARDKSGKLYLYNNKPVKEYNEWHNYDAYLLNISHYNEVMFAINNEDDIFPFIKWEDEEPWKVEDLLKLEVK